MRASNNFVSNFDLFARDGGQQMFGLTTRDEQREKSA